MSGSNVSDYAIVTLAITGGLEPESPLLIAVPVKVDRGFMDSTGSDRLATLADMASCAIEWNTVYPPPSWHFRGVRWCPEAANPTAAFEGETLMTSQSVNSMLLNIARLRRSDAVLAEAGADISSVAPGDILGFAFRGDEDGLRPSVAPRNICIVTAVEGGRIHAEVVNGCWPITIDAATGYHYYENASKTVGGRVTFSGALPDDMRANLVLVRDELYPLGGDYGKHVNHWHTEVVQGALDHMAEAIAAEPAPAPGR